MIDFTGKAGLTLRANSAHCLLLSDTPPPCSLGPARITIDNDGRIYVTSGDPGIQVFSAEGKYLGIIPLPRSSSSIAFSGPNKKVLYGKGAGMKNPDGTEYRTPGRNNAKAIYKIDTIAQGFMGRPK